MTLPTPYDVMMLHNYLTAHGQPSHLRTLHALVLAAGTPDFYADVADALARHPCTIRAECDVRLPGWLAINHAQNQCCHEKADHGRAEDQPRIHADAENQLAHRGRSLSARRKLKCSLAGLDSDLRIGRLKPSVRSLTLVSFHAAASATILALLLTGCSWSARAYHVDHGVDYCYDGQPVRLIAHYDHTARPVDWTCDPARWTR